jgi:hypothetical protein
VGLPVCEVIEFFIKEGVLGFNVSNNINHQKIGNLKIW